MIALEWIAAEFMLFFFCEPRGVNGDLVGPYSDLDRTAFVMASGNMSTKRRLMHAGRPIDCLPLSWSL